MHPVRIRSTWAASSAPKWCGAGSGWRQEHAWLGLRLAQVLLWCCRRCSGGRRRSTLRGAVAEAQNAGLRVNIGTNRPIRSGIHRNPFSSSFTLFAVAIRFCLLTAVATLVCTVKASSARRSINQSICSLVGVSIFKRRSIRIDSLEAKGVISRLLLDIPSRRARIEYSISG